MSAKFMLPLCAGLLLSTSVRADDVYKITSAGQAVGKVIDALKVETTAKYQPKNGQTFCNLFEYDASKSLGSAIPLQLANDMQDWLLSAGKNAGWWETHESLAQWYANNGYNVVASWKNSGGHGHICPVRPFTLGDTKKNEDKIAKDGPQTAQAGGFTSNSTTVSKGFGGAWTRKEVRFFAHQ